MAEETPSFQGRLFTESTRKNDRFSTPSSAGRFLAGESETPSPIGQFVLSGRKTSREKNEDADARTLASVQALRKQILGNRAITDITRQEFLSRLNPNFQNQGRISQSLFENTRAKFEAANLGQGKFGQRQDLQARISQIIDRPGRRQTILTR